MGAEEEGHAMNTEVLSLGSVYIACGKCGLAKKMTLAGQGGWVVFWNSLPTQKAKDPAVQKERAAPLITCATCRAGAGLDAMVFPRMRLKVFVACMHCGVVSQIAADDYVRLLFAHMPKEPDSVLEVKKPPIILCTACRPKFSTWGLAHNDGGIQV